MFLQKSGFHNIAAQLYLVVCSKHSDFQTSSALFVANIETTTRLVILGLVDLTESALLPMQQRSRPKMGGGDILTLGGQQCFVGTPPLKAQNDTICLKFRRARPHWTPWLRLCSHADSAKTKLTGEWVWLM